MQLENTFTVTAPLAKVWRALQDPALVAPCFPGAVLTECEGDSFAGDVRIKVGPITMSYKGTGSYLSRDDSSHTVVIDARGRDARGQGTAAAKVTGSLNALSDNETAVHMLAELTITGRAAQFGRSVIVEVADRIIAQFAQRLASTLSAGDASDRDPSATRALPAQDDSESLNLLAVAVVPALKRGLPVIGAVGLLSLITAIVVVRRARSNA